MMTFKEFYTEQLFPSREYTNTEVNVQKNRSSDCHLHVIPEVYFETAFKLAIMIHESGFEFDQILCSATNDALLGNFLSYVFKKPLAMLYTGGCGVPDAFQTGFGKHGYISAVDKDLEKKILYVDDVVDKDALIEQKLSMLQKSNSEIEFRTAVLWCKTNSNYKPTYCAQIVGEHIWIHQHFRKQSPERLRAVAMGNAEKFRQVLQPTRSKL